MSRLLSLLLVIAVARPGLAEVSLKTVKKTVACSALDKTRCAAFKALLDAGQDAVPVLLQALQATEQPLRGRAARIIARRELGDPAGRSKRLIAALADTPDDIVGETAEALGRLKVPSSIAALIGLLEKAPSGRTRIFAANGLGNFDAKAARDALIAALQSKTPRVQMAAAANLGRQPNAHAVAPLINRALAQPTAGFVAEACARALGRIGDGRALAPLVILLGHPQVSVRAAAARALAALGDRTAVPALLGRLGDDAIVDALVDALGALSDPRAEAALLTVSGRERLPLATRTRALWALGGFGTPKAVSGVSALLANDNAELVRAATETLGRMRHRGAAEHLLPLLGHNEQPIARTALWSLQQITGQKIGADAVAWRAWLTQNPLIDR